MSTTVITDSDLTRKVKKTCEKITENIYVTANEPMLACYRIQEHVHKTVPILADKTIEMHKNEPVLKGLLYDIEYSHSTVKSLSKCPEQFSSIQLLLKDCIFYKQQIDYNESVRRRVAERLLAQQKSQEAASKSPESSKPSTPTSKTSSNPKRISSNTNSSKFNRFSTSFDFSNATFPINLASSVSGDFKSFFNQFTSGHSHTTRPTQQSQSKVPTSSSLHILSETPIPQSDESQPKPIPKSTSPVPEVPEDEKIEE